MTESLLLGLMSGTSIDAIDAALLSISDDKMQLVGQLSHPLPETTRQAIAALSHSGDAEIERLGRLDRELGEHFAAAANALLQRYDTRPEQVRAIGSHGQTVRHRPPSSGLAGPAFTLQIGDPNTIAELTGITTVADFRRRDMAAGGEGAPLAPAFHAAAFGRHGATRACVNIGGIANISLLSDSVSGFDTGPGNTLMDGWATRHIDQAYDAGGSWAASGSVDNTLLAQLLSHPYLTKNPPKSTGKEDFNQAWLEQQLSRVSPMPKPADVQATLAEFTAVTICNALPEGVSELYVCGGGALNEHLMQRLQYHARGAEVAATTSLGIAPEWVEAAAFAWLAYRTLAQLPGNEPNVTGAAGPRVLGAVFPA